MILCRDIGGTAIKIAEAFSATDIRPQGRVPTPAQDYPAFVAALQAAVDAASIRPERLAFSIAGVVDPETGLATVANIPCLTGRRLQRDLEADLRLPVDLANDADCFALSEAAVGAGRGHDVVFGIILGTGVGGGLVVRGGLSNAPPLIAALDSEVRARTLRRFDRPLVVPAECAIEPGLVGTAILGLARQGRRPVWQRRADCGGLTAAG